MIQKEYQIKTYQLSNQYKQNLIELLPKNDHFTRKYEHQFTILNEMKLKELSKLNLSVNYRKGIVILFPTIYANYEYIV